MLEYRHKKWLIFVIVMLLSINIAILLDIPILRQILGLLFLTFLPGLLILMALKLDKIGLTEKIVLSVGLSVSFLMLFGFLINNLSLSIGYEAPLSTIFILTSFNLVFIILAFFVYKINKEKIFSFPNLSLTTSEKAFLIVPVLFPALSILGTYFMKTTGNNIFLMILLFLIPTYVIFVCYFNKKFSNRSYPVVLFLISISLLLIFMLRFPHIAGDDVHTEYGFFFQNTLDNFHWGIYGNSTLDSCLSISILPTIYQSTLDVNAQESLFKFVYVLICSFGPLVIYILSKKYVGEFYAFLASLLFISQLTFLNAAGSPRTNIAIFFVALAVMVIFHDEISPFKKRILFIVFMLSLIVSHYSTTYIFFFILLITCLIVEILSRIYGFKKIISMTIVILFFVVMFLWYSQIIETPFNASVGFVKNSIASLSNFFVGEVRAPELGKLYGQGLSYPVLSRINLAVTWGTFIFIGVGILAATTKFKKMIGIPNLKLQKPDFLKSKFEIEYVIMAWLCSGLLVAMILIPFFSVGYEIQRLYSLVLVFLCVYFVVGIIILSKYLKIKPYFIMLLILVPYFLFGTGAIYQLSGGTTSMILNSEGELYDIEYLHDQESFGAKWLSNNIEANTMLYVADNPGANKLISQGKISPQLIDYSSFPSRYKITGPLYLSYNNIVNGKFVFKDNIYDMANYTDVFIDKNKIYDNGGSEVYQ